ncbi:flagellar basal body rod protein FlgG [Sporosarcina cyprini]|uniref:flagellar basal body rod protein FlgG n=1 Tax=Sporosarcina cyprini TaxID=2910523 RepID=UPI001EDF96AD|nr:flagellar basal body rod protein FlgG [Sporosarcina cyprini]MCG3090096.1 flagellar basal body rod protein FlgG [Sporosarcina cyprini]
MLRSMYSGISGLKNFQTKLDVIGNNIANVNTYGFKKGRVIFKDLISQTVAGASSGNASRGGVNAKQVGLGSQIAAIDTLHTGGSTQFTGNTLDLAIAGDGFFQVGEMSGTTLGNVQYTRAGNFYMDNKGYLVDGGGKYLVGVGGSTTGTYAPVTKDDLITAPTVGATPTYTQILIPTTAQSMSVAQDGAVSFVDEDGFLRYAGHLVLAKFPNPGGMEKIGGNYFQKSSNSGDATVNIPTQSGIGDLESGFLEMSNVDLSEEFTEMIVAQRGFQANTRIITTSDEILQELVNLKR